MMKTDPPTPPLYKWDIRHQADVDWVPWGNQGDAKAKVLAEADGYMVVLVQADPGYRCGAHEHTSAEFFYLVDDWSETRVRPCAGDACAAGEGSIHTYFETQAPPTYISIIRL